MMIILHDEKAVNKPPFVVKQAHAGTVVYPPGGRLGHRIQNDLQLVLLHTGSMDILIDGIMHQIPKGHVTLLKPGHSEKFYFSKSEETWHRWISVTSDQQQSEIIKQLEQFPRYIPISDQMNQITSLMLAVSQDYREHNKEVLCSLGESAIWLYMTECLHQSRSKIHPAVLKAKEIIHRKYSDELSLKEIAQESHVCPEHLIRLFQKHEQITPIQYLWNYRLECGLRLLRNTGLQIGEIALQTGFKTSYHFSRTIKLKTGKTPSQIRAETQVTS